MKKYIFTIDKGEQEEEIVPIVAKNLQSAVAKLCQGDFYYEDQISNIEIIKS